MTDLDLGRDTSHRHHQERLLKSDPKISAFVKTLTGKTVQQKEVPQDRTSSRI